MSSPTNLKQIIASTWSRLTAGSSYNGLTFRLDLPEDLVIQSDPGKLEIVFANVLGNALSYSRPEGEILCAGIRNGDRFQLDISNPAERSERRTSSGLPNRSGARTRRAPPLHMRGSGSRSCPRSRRSCGSRSASPRIRMGRSRSAWPGLPSKTPRMAAPAKAGVSFS